MYTNTPRRRRDGMQSLERLNTMLEDAFGAWPFQQENGALTAA